MGVQIITGGAAGQFGSGLGKGLNEGIDAKQAQMKADAEKQALADDYTAAMKMFIAPQVEALEGQIPAQLEPQGPLPGPGAGPLAAGVQGPPEAPNAVPEYMRPRPNPEREQLDAIAQQFALGVSSLREPEAIKLATQAASQQLDMLQRQILVKKVNDQLSFAKRTGGFDDAEVQNFLNMGLAIAQGEGDITDLYSAIRERKEEKVKHDVDFARATSFIEDSAKTVESLAMSSGAESDPTIAGWYTNQAGLLNDKLVYMQEALKYGLDDFDFDAASKEVLDIKHALNPYQEAKFKQQLEQETLRMRNYYNELEDIRSNKYLTEEKKATALEAAKKAYGSDAPAQSNVGGRGQSGGPSTPLLGDIYRAGPGSFGTTLEEIENTGGRVFYGAAKQVADVAGYEFSKNFSVSMPKDDFVDEVVGLVKHLKANGNEEFAMSFAGTMMDGIKLWEDEKRKAGGFKPETSVVDPETGTPVSMDQTTRIISDPQVERFKKQYYGQPR